jgi:hypothetical protein
MEMDRWYQQVVPRQMCCFLHELFIVLANGIKKGGPSAESCSHTRWGLGNDYTRQVLPLHIMQRGCVELLANGIYSIKILTAYE